MIVKILKNIMIILCIAGICISFYAASDILADIIIKFLYGEDDK